MAAAASLAEASPCRRAGGENLLPPVEELRAVARRVAVAVALAAQQERLAPPIDRGVLEAEIDRRIWSPVYRPYRRIR
jgi:malic enzyme